MSTLLQPTRALLLALASASLLTACAPTTHTPNSQPDTANTSKSQRPVVTPPTGGYNASIATLTLSDKTAGSPPFTAVDLAYTNGAEVKARFESADLSIIDTTGTAEPGSGITIEDGLVFVKATNLPVIRATAPRFWRIVRRRKVSVGAEGTEFLVQATNEKDPKGTIIAKIHMSSGTSVLIETPEDMQKLTKADSQAYVYVDEKDVHTIEILTKPDLALKALADRLAKLP